jgi:hypothetical protein
MKLGEPWTNLVVGPNQTNGKVPFRVIAPYHGIEKGVFKTNADPNNFDKYITDVWTNYTVGKASLTTKPCNIPEQLFGNATSSAGNFVFRKGSATGPIAFQIPRPNVKTLYENALIPSLLGPDGQKLPNPGCEATETARDLASQFMRSTLLVDSTLQQAPCKPDFKDKFYKNSPINRYSKFWHDNSINGLAYGFGYDDTCDQSGIVFVDNPTGMTITFGGGGT